ncbi:hypothetical protein [Sorangium sp. So ce1024]|uniref:hypothetical protein n=1 Tax=Sorangium sp. So ce1024 TaxID=3133327 RepID=UPI003F084173
MNASIRRMHVALGSIALLALAAGCGGERRPAKPVTGTPTFESEVPHDEMPYDAHEHPPGAAPRHAPPGPGGFGRSPADQGGTYPGGERGYHGEHGHHGGENGHHGGERGYQGGERGYQGGERGYQGGERGYQGGERGHQGGERGINEHALCEQLAASTSISAEDIPHGVQIVMIPSPGANAASLDTLARQLDAYLGAISLAGDEPSNGVATRCSLFDMARTGARGRVIEAADGLRVLFTSPDPEDVPLLRQQAREFVESAREGQFR